MEFKTFRLSCSALALLLALLPMFVVDASGAEKGAKKFRVMTFNIHHGVGVDEKFDLQRIAQLVKSERADLVALQEIDRNLARSQKLDLAAELAKLTGFNVVFSNNFAFSGGEYGNAILSRFPIKSRDHRLLPTIDKSEQRGWLQAVVEVNGRDLCFWNTHIDHRGNDAERMEASKKFNVWVREEKRPVILCGDFNDTPGSRVHELMKEQWRDAWEEVGKGRGNTYPVVNSEKRIDYIWISKGAPLKPLKAWVPNTVASDNLPIVAEFTWE